MTENKIEVEYITTVAGALQAVEKLNKRLDQQEQKLQRVGEVSKKAAEGAAGSFNKLEEELKQNEAALKRMEIGSKAFTEQKKKVDDLRKSLAGAKGQLSTVADGASTKLASAVGQVTGLVTGMVSFQAVVTAIVEEFKKAEAMRLSAAATARTFEQALSDVGQNIGEEAVPQAKQMIIEQAPKLATTQEGLADLLGIAISAGAKDLEEAMALSSAALKLTVGDAAKAKALVGGTLDVASLGGSKNFEGALGQLLQTQSQVRSTNLSEFAANIGPGLAAATADGKNQKGVSTERALEMASVISQIIKDPTGSNTATTMRYLFTRMNAFMPEREKKLDDGGLAKVSKEQIAAFDALKTFDERLQMMQAVPAIGAQFLETQRESIGKTAISEIINKSGRAIQFEDKAKANIASIDDAQGFFAGLVDKVNQETGILTAERQSLAAAQKAEVTGSRSLEGQVTEIVRRGFEKVNLPGLDMVYSKVASVSLQDSLRRGEEPIAAGRQLLEGVRSRFDTSEEDKAYLRDQIAVLDRLATTMQNLNDNMQNQKPKVIVPAGRPKEAPLPAATAP